MASSCNSSVWGTEAGGSLKCRLIPGIHNMAVTQTKVFKSKSPTPPPVACTPKQEPVRSKGATADPVS